jgi:hypothetical protein
MNSRKTATILVAAGLAACPRVFAQSPSRPHAFVDLSVTGDQNPVGDPRRPPDGHAIRATVGKTAGHHDWRLEVDVASRRIIEADYTALGYCAVESSCGPGYVPTHTQARSESRAMSVAAIYAQHLPAFGRLELSLIGGGAIEHEALKSSQQSDILDAAGRVVSHSAYADDDTSGAISGVMGVDAQLRLTPHLAVVPQLRYHYFPYPAVAILRPGVALRWQF